MLVNLKVIISPVKGAVHGKNVIFFNVYYLHIFLLNVS